MLCVCLDGANWLTFFCQPVKSWNGLILRKPIDMEKRELIQRQEATLLDLRSYLFSRQCTLLLFLQRPCEVAQRALELLHSCVQELQLLEVSRPAPPRPVRTEPAPRPCPNAGAWDSFPPDVRGFSVFVVTLDADYIIAGEHGFHSQRDGVRVGPRWPAQACWTTSSLSLSQRPWHAPREQVLAAGLLTRQTRTPRVGFISAICALHVTTQVTVRGAHGPRRGRSSTEGT